MANTLKVWIDCDEWYPVCSASAKYKYGTQVEVSIEFMERYDKLLDDFDKMQKELIKLYGS